MFNITQGNTAQFVVEPLSTAGVLITPSSVNFTISYTSGGVPTVTQVSMALTGSFWVGTWNSTPADLGIALWSVSYPGVGGIAATGSLNIIDP